jgi:CheY-like chemotaxis protein/predicted regulator of Ras-like GTPase activity (Roadblock/LC7/MglB family)
MPKVMVVDDSVSVRKVVEHALAPRQMEVIAASTGTEAVERLEGERPDVVICDVILPDKDGYEICAFVRAHARLGGTPVLLISGIVDERVRERAAQVKANDVMFKPFTADTLVRKVNELLAARTEPAPASRRPEPAASGFESVRQLATVPGIRWALVVDREGFVIEAAGEAIPDADAAAAFASCLREATDAIGRELAQGPLQGMMLEYDKTTLLVHGIDTHAVLVVSVTDAGALGKARYYVKKALPELQRAL